MNFEEPPAVWILAELRVDGSKQRVWNPYNIYWSIVVSYNIDAYNYDVLPCTKDAKIWADLNGYDKPHIYLVNMADSTRHECKKSEILSKLIKN